MLQTNAILSRKESTFETNDCIIEKVIRLSGTEYDRFTANMLQDQDFIKNNNDLMRPGTDGRFHCLLVTGEGRRDGILVDSSGHDYARYSAFIPNAEDFLTVGRSPALTALNKKLTMIVDVIAEQAGAGNPEGRGVVNLQDWGALFEIDIMTNGVLRRTVLDMIGERPEIRDFEIDKNELIIYREPDGAKDIAGDVPVTESSGVYLSPIEVLIVNQERHEKGEAVSEWLALPADAETLAGLFIRIGVAGPYAEGYGIHDFCSPYEGVRETLNSNDSLDGLNTLASYISDMEDWELAKLQATLKLDIISAGDGADALINLLHEDNFDSFSLIDAANEEEIGRYWDNEDPISYPEGVSHAEHGREIVAEEKGIFTKWGYASFRYKELSQEYDGIVPHEYRIVDKALLDASRHSMPERGGPDEKPSVLDQIKAARLAPREPKDKGAQTHKKDKGGPEL